MMKSTSMQTRLFIAMIAITLLFAASSFVTAQEGAKYKVGDCVEHDTTNVSNPAARWRRGQISKNDGYFFTIEFETRDGKEPETTIVSLASAHKWLREASGCAAKKTEDTEEPKADAPPKETPKAKRPSETPGEGSGGCSFNKDYRKVSNSAAASAELFKGVIFEWEYSLNKRFRDFGLTFLNFQMGKPFKNRVYPGINVRKDVDTAPVGATIYPIKTKQLICQKDISITIRWVWEIEYSCFKDKFGQWVCNNNAPKQLEHTSMPNK